MTSPYYADESVTLYLGDCREVVPTLTPVDMVLADPPYGETSLRWDRWPDCWPTAAAALTRSLWCFGSLRMFLKRRDDFVGWRLSQDVVWEKHNGSGFAADRFKRVHEIVAHWYRGQWGDLYRNPQREASSQHQGGMMVRRRKNGTPHAGAIAAETAVLDGTRLVRSVIQARSLHHGALHPCEKPADILRPLIDYSCPPGGIVLDPFAGSGSTLEAARASGRRAVGIEADERYCEVAARRLSQADLFAVTRPAPETASRAPSPP